MSVTRSLHVCGNPRCRRYREEGGWYGPLLLLSVLIFLPHTDSLSAYTSENVFLVTIDGIRDQEAFEYGFEPGETEHPYLPFIWNELKPQGTAFMEMYNVFCTFTSPGHATILTGAWQMFPNHASQGEWFQTRAWSPTIFEYARKQLGLSQSETWCVVGKKNCLESDWSIHPAYGEDYGANLLHEPSGQITLDTDSLTVDGLMGVLDADQPSMVFVNLQGTDALGHYGDYDLYLEAIQLADRAVERIWSRIQNDPHYSSNTTLIVTTDHGRHDDSHGGFSSHGGICHGCQHIMCLIVGPDTPSGVEVTRRTFQIDIAPTIGELIGFDVPYADGQVLDEAVTGYDGPDRFIVKDPATDVYEGMVFVTWSDNSTGSDEVYFLASFDGGNTFGDTVQLSSSQAAAIQPDITADAVGVHVVWLDFRQGIWELYYRRSEDYGITWDPEQRLAANIEEDENGQGHAMMWEPFILSELGGSMITVSAQPISIGALLSYDGGDTWEFELIDNSAFFPVSVNGCRLSAMAGVTWCDQAAEGDRNWDVYYKLSGVLGKNWNVLRQLSSNPSYSIQPNVDSNGNKRLGVAWADNEFGSFRIFFRKSHNKGKKWFGRNVVSYGSGGSWQPDLAWDRSAGDNVHLVWTDYRDGNGELYYRLYNGSTWSDEERLTFTEGSVNLPSFAVDEYGNTFMVWEERTASGSRMQMGNMISP